MHIDFADWYRAVSLEPKSEELQKRWKAIEAYTQNSEVADLLDLTRLFFDLPRQPIEFQERFRLPFKEVDDTFAMQSNTAELQVLAGATLVNHFEVDDDWAVAAALCIACASCQGMRRAPIGAIVELAQKQLRTQSSSLRERYLQTVNEPPDISPDLTKLKTAFQSGNLPSVEDPLSAILESLGASVKELGHWARRMESQLSIGREESDILWWLMGSHSRDLHRHYSDLEGPASCLIAAKEMADLTKMLPGPYSVEAFLDNVLRDKFSKDQTVVSIADAVTSCPYEWQKELLSGGLDEPVQSICAVHLALKCWLDAERDAAWLVLFQKTSGLSGNEGIDPLQLALQMYQERLFIRSLLKLKNG